MKHITLFTLITALFFAACETAVEHKPGIVADANANTAKPGAVAPTLDALFAMEKQANEALIKGDAKYFEGFLSDKFVSYDKGQRMSKPEILKMMSTMKCDVKDWKLEESADGTDRRQCICREL